jgi:hypothetical protein
MEVRYLGFEQRQNARSYQFEIVEKGELPRSSIVTTDLSLFRTNGVTIQEGPTLCASKLVADLEKSFTGPHELTAEDFHAYVNARSLAEAKRAEMRKPARRNPSPSEEEPPWRGF